MLRKTLISILLISLFAAQTVNAAFPDIQNSPYQLAILDLQNREILEGYPDGIFKPSGLIARSELLKIIMESSGITTDSSYQTRCFSDIDPTQWYASYVCKAKELGWVEGYPDLTFKPGADIARSEALKIISVAENWTLTENSNQFLDVDPTQWYSGYANNAKIKNVLPYSNYFSPGAKVTREEFAEIYHRIIVTKENNAEVYQKSFSGQIQNPIDSTEQDEENTVDLNNVNISTRSEDSSYEEDIFEHAILDDRLPVTIYQNEIYLIEGEFNDNSYKRGFAFYYPENNQSEITRISTKADNGKFSLPLIFKEPGTYYLGLIPGNGGSSTIARINVEASLPAISSNTEFTTSGNFERPSFDLQRTYINFSSNQELHQIIISQDNETVTYYNRQGITSLPVVYSDFQNFNKGNVSVKINATTADTLFPIKNRNSWKQVTSGTFYATDHYFSDIDEEISLTNTPLDFNNQVPIIFTGTTQLEITPTLHVIIPDGLVEDYNFGNENYEAGDIFEYSFTPTENKTYIFEVNKPDGISAINHPVYPINQIPLLPDHLDLTPLNLEPDSNFSEQSAISELLNLINQARAQQDLNPVTLDTELSTLAKAHNTDMLSNDYLAHINLLGQSPNDRRIAAGIPNPVGENIALTTSVIHGHHGFMRSAVHRDNILTPEWSKVGLSVLKNSEGYVYITEEFSYSSEDIIPLIQNALDEYNLSNNGELNDIAQIWSEQMSEEDFFNTTSPNGDTINELFVNNTSSNITEARVYILKSSNINGLKASIETLSELNDPNWPERGVGLELSQSGQGLVTILFGR